MRQQTMPEGQQPFTGMQRKQCTRPAWWLMRARPARRRDWQGHATRTPENHTMTETTNNILGENMLPLAEIAKPVFNITPPALPSARRPPTPCPSRHSASAAPAGARCTCSRRTWRDGGAIERPAQRRSIVRCRPFDFLSHRCANRCDRGLATEGDRSNRSSGTPTSSRSMCWRSWRSRAKTPAAPQSQTPRAHPSCCETRHQALSGLHPACTSTCLCSRAGGSRPSA